jgi:hypothetical protein
MFDSLEEIIKKDEGTISAGNRIARYALYAVTSVLVCGGLIFFVQLLLRFTPVVRSIFRPL